MRRIPVDGIHHVNTHFLPVSLLGPDDDCFWFSDIWSDALCWMEAAP